MELRQPLDLLSLEVGDAVSKRNFYDLIQLSKVKGSEYWAGKDSQIGNTPQQGINWLGTLPECRAVIVKTKPGSYKEDGWSSESKESYRYSFKARNETISYTEKANQVLIKQPQHGYPVLLFTENKSLWVFEGRFQVSEILESFVRLKRLHGDDRAVGVSQQEAVYLEGGRKYVSHLMVERNSKVVAAAKSCQPWVCEICLNDFSYRYGVKYIEAHHKVPLSTYSESYQVKPADFALLCPNCHTAVHILMKTEYMSYDEIKSRLRAAKA